MHSLLHNKAHNREQVLAILWLGDDVESLFEPVRQQAADRKLCQCNNTLLLTAFVTCRHAQPGKKRDGISVIAVITQPDIAPLHGLAVFDTGERLKRSLRVLQGLPQAWLCGHICVGASWAQSVCRRGRAGAMQRQCRVGQAAHLVHADCQGVGARQGAKNGHAMCDASA